MRHDPEARTALLAALHLLAAEGYHFVTPTPATHARIVARPECRAACSLRDVFGWSLPFAPGLLPPALHAALDTAGAIGRRGDLLVARLRVSSLGGTLFLHSAFPTDHAHAVFLGPDTYRFAAFITANLAGLGPGARIVDVGTGAGAGAVVAGRCLPGVPPTMTDINPDALFLAEINAAFAGLVVTPVHASALDGQPGPFDLVLANPPFIMDLERRAYRDGGDMHGAGISYGWAQAAAARLAPGGRLLLYTGSAIVDGRDALYEALVACHGELGCTLDYRELDPDIFGEELDEPAYRAVERIAAVGIVMTRGG